MQAGPESPTGLIARALDAHVVYAPDARHPIEVVAAERDHLNAWLSRRIQHQIAAPDLASAGHELLGGRLLSDGELSHRSKNLLMVVLAIANQTVAHAMSFGEFQANFEGRLMALARSHDLLVERGWTGATIEALIFTQLKPFMDEPASRVDVAGPPITLAPEAAQNIGLAVHELATNAIKFGALSSPGGHIVVRWELDDRQTPKRFRLSWQKHGGPRVDPPSYEGFGRKLLSHIAKGTPDEVSLVFAPEGIAWSMECEEQLVLRH